MVAQVEQVESRKKVTISVLVLYREKLLVCLEQEMRPLEIARIRKQVALADKRLLQWAVRWLPLDVLQEAFVEKAKQGWLGGKDE